MISKLKAMSILKAELEANPSRYTVQSRVLTFAYAEAQEIRKEFADVHTTYDKFLTLLRSQLETLEQTTNSANASFSSTTATGLNNGPGNGVLSNNAPATAEAGAGAQSNNSSFSTQSDEKPPKHTELQRLRTEYGVAWIMYMRFGRRAEGVKSLRGSLERPGGIVGYHGRYTKLLVCSSFVVFIQLQ